MQREYTKTAGRLHLVRVTRSRAGGKLHAAPTGDQGSAVLLSMVRADGLAVVDADVTRVPAGSEVPVQLLNRGDLSEDPGF